MASIDASTSGAGGVITTADASGILNLQTASTTAVTIDTSQNVGIGVTPSTMSAGIKAIQIGTGSADGFFYGLGGNDTEITTNAYFNSGYKYQTSSNAATRYFQSSGIHSWSYAASGTAGNPITFTEAMRIDSSGNVGIGTTSPGGSSTDRQLSVVGSTSAQITANSGTVTTNFGSTSSIGYIQNTGAFPLTLWTSNTERMRIDSNGNVGIGITPTNASLLQLAAGTTAKAPLELTSGPLRTTAEGGAFEYLTNVGYFTPTNNNRAVNVTEHFVARTGTKTMTSNTALQSIFGGGTGGLTNGALTVDAATSYYFECLISITSMSATTGNFGFSIGGAGTATFTSAGFFTVGYDNSTLTAPATGGGIYNATAAITTNIIPTQPGTGAAALIKGIFRINGGGTIIPSIQLTTAAAAVIGANSWFKCNPIGDNNVVSVGNWS